MHSPETPQVNPHLFAADFDTIFDADFFADYEQELSDVSVEDQASAALQDILTVTKADGTEKTYQDIRDESRSFFANDSVQRDESLVNRMAMEFAAACMSHPHGAELAQDASLGPTFASGVDSLYASQHSHADKNHKTANKGKEQSDEEIDPATGKKKKKKKKYGWQDILESIRKRAAARAARNKTVARNQTKAGTFGVK